MTYNKFSYRDFRVAPYTTVIQVTQSTPAPLYTPGIVILITGICSPLRSVSKLFQKVEALFISDYAISNRQGPNAHYLNTVEIIATARPEGARCYKAPTDLVPAPIPEIYATKRTLHIQLRLTVPPVTNFDFSGNRKNNTNMTTLLSLPLELQQQIAACVEAAHRPSLYAFSLTSKACRSASAFLIFRKIRIEVHSCERLRSDVDNLLETLSRTDSARHVQYIGIAGDLGLRPKHWDDDTSSDWWRESGLAEILTDEDPRYSSRFHVVYDEPVIKESSDEDMAWAPVVTLLQEIPHLKDLVYNCRNQFPPSLLRTLREHQPQCRLHHLTFRFRTLLWGVPYPYEMELATSPSLYRVRLKCADRDSDGDDDFNAEAMMELVAELAPNLKEVEILDLYPVRPGHYSRAGTRDTWKGLPGFTGNAVGSLTSLSVKCSRKFRTESLLQDWARHTDFTFLEHLTLGGSWHEKSAGLSGETMDWMAQNLSFPRIRTLSVYLTRDDIFPESPTYSENAVSFFEVFEPLEGLFIHGPLDIHIFNAVLSRHGQKLKKLSLHPYEYPHNFGNGRNRLDVPMEFTKECVLQIQAECPVLEELALPVSRNKSSAAEAEVYKCFGKMGNLRSLFLKLDYSSTIWRVRRDSTYSWDFDEEDQRLVRHTGLRSGHLKEILINCAVDETLARSIWKVIEQNKTGKRLERLKVWTMNDFFWGPCCYSTCIEHLARSWLIERAPRDDQEGISVAELGRCARHCDRDNVRLGCTHEGSDDGKVFRAIWPSKEGSKDWRDDWSSFPLQV